jgi:hypothetical protein
MVYCTRPLYYQEKKQQKFTTCSRNRTWHVTIRLNSFQLRIIPSPPFSDELRESCRNRLLGCLADLGSGLSFLCPYSTTWLVSGNTTKSSDDTLDGETWISTVLQTIESFSGDTGHLLTLFEPNEQLRSLYSDARSVTDQLKKVAGLRLIVVCWRLLVESKRRHCQGSFTPYQYSSSQTALHWESLGFGHSEPRGSSESVLLFVKLTSG